MCETLGYNNFCSACKGSREENGELVCRDKGGRFYGIPVKQVLLAPCMERKVSRIAKGDCNEQEKTTEFLGSLLVSNRFAGMGKYWAKEVSIDPWAAKRET